MDRDTALGQLQEIRQEILAIHNEMETCQTLQKQAEALHNEKEHPVQPTVQLKEENTGAKLKQAFEKQNSDRICNSKLPAILQRTVSAAVQAVILVLLGLDIFGHKGLIISTESLSVLNSGGSSNGAILFFVHLLLTVGIVLVSAFWKSMRTKHKVPLCIFSGILLIVYLIMCTGVSTFTYLFLMLGGVIAALAVGGIAALVKKGRVNQTALSAEQKKQVEEAVAADERAKKENARRIAEAQQQWDGERRKRIPEIDREIKEKIQQFNEARERLNSHMERLDAMDALCEDDKTLQIVDLLIRFIETRRADSVKEALQEYDKLMANRQLLEIEKKKLAAELSRAAQEHDDRMQQLEAQRRHQAEMEYLAWDSAQSRAKIAGQLDHLDAMIYYGTHN